MKITEDADSKYHAYSISPKRNKKNQIRKERYSKEKGAEFYLENKEAIKEKPKNQYENLSKKEKD